MNERTAMPDHGSVFLCADFIRSDCVTANSCVPLYGYGKERTYDHPLYYQLQDEPNPAVRWRLGQRRGMWYGLVSIPVTFSVSPKWLKLLTGFKQKVKIMVKYFDTETLEMKQTGMFIEGYKEAL